MCSTVSVVRPVSIVKDEDALPDGFFKQWKNKHLDEPAFLLGSGPTINHFPVSKHKGVYVGVNDIHIHPKIKDKLNYLITEKNHPELRNLPDELPVFHHDRVELDKPNSFKCFRNLSEWGGPFYGSHVKAEPRCCHAPLRDFTEQIGAVSMIYLGLFFCLHIGCRRIYLVGCDCSSGNKFSKSLEAGTYGFYANVWKRVGEYVKQTHPDVEITNINPVNLEGVFPSIYSSEDDGT